MVPEVIAKASPLHAISHDSKSGIDSRLKSDYGVYLADIDYQRYGQSGACIAPPVSPRLASHAQKAHGEDEAVQQTLQPHIKI